MRKNAKKLIHVLLAIAMLANLFAVPAVAEAEQSIPDIEVTLAADAASNNLDLSGFSDTLKEKLSSKFGIPSDKVHVTSVDTSSVSSDIEWYRFDHTNYADKEVDTDKSLVKFYDDPYIGPGKWTNYLNDSHIVVSGGNIDFYGYGSPAYKDFLFTPNNNANNKVFSFVLDEQVVDYHTAEGVGFLFNAKYQYNSSADRRLSGYLVLVGQSNMFLYRLDNIKADEFFNEYSYGLMDVTYYMGGSYWGGTVTRVATTPKPAASSGTLRYLKLAASPTAVSFYQFTDNTYGTIKNKIFDNIALDTTYNTFGFGPIACYTSHGCQVQTHVQFSNIKMIEDTSVTFTETVKNTTWNYPGSLRIIVNVDNDGVPDFANDSDLSAILYYMMQNNAYYLGWGVNNTLVPAIGGYTTVEAQAQGFIERNKGRGTFIDRSDASSDSLSEGISALADYIGANMGFVPQIEKPVINLQYDSGFLSNGNVTCSTPTAVTSLGNPVGAYRWDALNVHTGAWEEKGTAATTSLAFPTGSYNIVSLKIQDSVTSRWSDYAIAYIANETGAPSVSMFTLDRTELMPDTPIESLRTSGSVVAADASYHPAGEDLTDWEWKVYNPTLVEQTDMAKTYTNASRPSAISFDFSSKPAGKYTIKLRVKKGASGTWSAYYSQNVTLFRESDAIAAVRTNPAGSGNVNYSGSQDFTFNITSAGDALASYRIIKIPVGEGTNVIGDWTTVSGLSASGTSNVSGGSYEIFVQARDVSGNCKTQSIGIFSLGSAPAVTNTRTVNVAGMRATLSAEVSAPNGPAVTQRGIQYRTVSDSAYSEPVYSAVYDEDGGTGVFTIDLTGLTPNTAYFARGFATNSMGTSYDETGVEFTTTARTLTAVPDRALTDSNLNGRRISLEVTGDSFADESLSLGSITLNNAPRGLSVTSATYTNSSAFTVVLSYSGSSFSNNYDSFSITVGGTEFTEGTALTSNTVRITGTYQDSSDDSDTIGTTPTAPTNNKDSGSLVDKVAKDAETPSGASAGKVAAGTSEAVDALLRESGLGQISVTETAKSAQILSDAMLKSVESVSSGKVATDSAKSLEKLANLSSGIVVTSSVLEDARTAASTLDKTADAFAKLADKVAGIDASAADKLQTADAAAGALKGMSDAAVAGSQSDIRGTVLESAYKTAQALNKVVDSMAAAGAANQAVDTVKKAVDATKALQAENGDLKEQFLREKVIKTVANAANTALKGLGTAEAGAVAENSVQKVVLGEEQLPALNGKMDAVLSAAGDLQAAVNAVGTAGGEGTAGGPGAIMKLEKTLNIQVPAAAGINGVRVEVANAIFDAASDKGMDKLQITSALADVALKPGVAAGMGADSISINIGKVEASSMPESVRQVAGDTGNVISIWLSAGKDGTAADVQKLAKPMEVSMPYTLKAGENPDKITVFRVAPDGSAENLAGIYDPATGTVRFTTTGTGDFVARENNVSYNDSGLAGYAKEAVDAMLAKGIFELDENGRFNPLIPITRAEVAAAYVRLLKLDQTAGTDSGRTFNDIAGSKYSGEIGAASASGLMVGRPGGSFAPDETIKREDLALVSRRALTQYLSGRDPSKTDESLSYSDKGDISGYAALGVATTSKYGVMIGTGDGRFNPQGKLNRGDSALMIYRIYKLIENNLD